MLVIMIALPILDFFCFWCSSRITCHLWIVLLEIDDAVFLPAHSFNNKPTVSAPVASCTFSTNMAVCHVTSAKMAKIFLLKQTELPNFNS